MLLFIQQMADQEERKKIYAMTLNVPDGDFETAHNYGFDFATTANKETKLQKKKKHKRKKNDCFNIS